MLTLDKDLHEGIKCGKTTVAYRNWDKSPLTERRHYRIHDLGDIEVTEVTQVSLSEISEEDARAAGYESLAAWRDAYLHINPQTNFDADCAFCVRFEYLGNDAERVLSGNLAEGDLRRLDRELAHIDTLSFQGEWTMAYISALTQKRWLRPGELAQQLGSDQDMIRRKMNMLVDLGLVRADPGLGFSLSNGGRKVYSFRMR